MSGLHQAGDSNGPHPGEDRYEIGKPTLNTETSVNADVAIQRRRTEFDYPTVGYGLVNLDSGLEHGLFGRAFTFDLGVRNLLNRRYKNYLSRYKEFALDPGLNVPFRVSTGM